MREFLFKGKRKDTGEWVEGYLSKTRDITERPAILQYCIDYEESGVLMSSLIVPETISEYTGLTDKNGTKIFEGDIVEFYFYDKTRRNGELIDVKNTRTMLIEWKDSSFYMTELYRNYYLDKVVTETIFDYKGSKKQGVYQSNSTYTVEVIGNIFDNPELLKGADNNAHN